jgi:isocitrate dehydrogenase (NAD+)
VHGSAPDIAGQNVANPTALMRAAIQMLRHIGEREAAERLDKAVKQIYAEGKSLTRDVGGQAGTTEFAEAVVRRMESGK